MDGGATPASEVGDDGPGRERLLGVLCPDLVACLQALDDVGDRGALGHLDHALTLGVMDVQPHDPTSFVGVDGWTSLARPVGFT
jgi:hypothetical protein